MPARWAGTWKGGRYYLDADGRKVFWIERRGRAKKLETHDEALAVGELARFLSDPEAFCRPVVRLSTDPVQITKDRLTLYMESIHHAVVDHRKARRSYLDKWADLGLDLRTVDRKSLRTALATFTGGHKGRVEALNAFARFLVKEGDLPSWNPLVSHRDAKPTRAEREAYSLDQLCETFDRLEDQSIRDLFLLRVATGMHQTEIDQLLGCKVTGAALPDKGVWIRELGGDHEIQGVLQVMHKSRHRHRQSVNASVLEAALRLRAGVPHRVAVWEAMAPMVPSNLRHTFVTLAGDTGRLVSYATDGVDRSRVAQAIGHRAGSTMTADRYEKVQVPPMIALPLRFF